MSWTNDYFYEVGENVYFNWYVNCTVIDENYTLNATVYNEDDGAVHGYYNLDWWRLQPQGLSQNQSHYRLVIIA